MITKRLNKLHKQLLLEHHYNPDKWKLKNETDIYYIFINKDTLNVRKIRKDNDKIC